VPIGPYLLRSVVSVNPTYVVLGTYQIFSTRGAKSSYIMGRGTFVARARCLRQRPHVWAACLQRWGLEVAAPWVVPALPARDGRHDLGASWPAFPRRESRHDLGDHP
jgi:hypothetical protein